MKRIPAILLSIIMCFSFSSCAETRVQKDSYTVAVVLPSGSGYVGEMVEQAEKQAEDTMREHSQINIIVSEAKTSSEQVSEIGRLNDENELDVLIVCPIDPEALRNAVESVMKTGTEVIVYDKTIDNLKGTINITPDRSAIAEATAKYIQNYFAQNETAGYLLVASDDFITSTAMIDTFNKSLGGAERFIKKGDTLYGNYTSANAKKAVADWLRTASPEDIESLKLIVTQYDEMASGILEALEEYKGSAELNVKLVTSIGARKDTIKKFADTKLETKLFTMYYSPTMIRETVKYAASLLLGEKYELKQKDGIYLIDSFSVSNADNADMNFEDYTSSGYYIERYPSEEEEAK